MFLERFFKKKTNYNPLSASLLKEYNKHRPLGPQKYSCYAPFKSIYFGHHGRANVCCYNRAHVIGEYPKQSIKEIWFGEEANKLREYIHNDDFSLGCLGCKQQLVAQNFDAVKAKQYDEQPLNANKYPSVMEFELSNVCNLECEMCSGDFSSLIRAKREKLPPLEIAYDAAFVKQLEEFIPYLDEVKFYGGEPFLIDIYYDIWEKIMELNPKVRISIQTNATVLNNRVKRILEDTNFHINVSFDSLQKETYESIRKNAEFERTLENLKWFREYARERNIFFGISVCAMQQNWKELPDFITFCNDLDVPVYFHTVSQPSHCSIREMKPVEIKAVIEHLSQFNFPEANSVQKKNKKHYKDYLGQLSEWYEHAHKLDFTIQAEKFADIENLVSNHIMKDASIDCEQKQTMANELRKKITELRQKLSDDFVKNNMKYIDTKDNLIFENIIAKVNEWHLHIDKLKIVTHLETFTDLGNLVIERIRKNELLSETEKQTKLKEVDGKVQILKLELSDDFIKDNLKNIDTSDLSTLDKMIFALENLPASDMIVMAKAKIK